MSHSRSRQDIHAEITNKLIKAIEANPGQPVMPWRKSGNPLWLPVNARTGNRYNGINVISLWVAADAASYAHPVWATYRQWQHLDAQVRKGEKASLVVFYKPYDTDPDPDDPENDGKRRVARASWVFNCAQVDGYAPPPQPEPLGPIERIFNADRFFAACGAKIVHGGEEAYYRLSTDTIHMPDENLFTGTATMKRGEAYFAVLGHEHIHWTGHGTRLNRNLTQRFGKAERAAEELVAEIGSAFLCAELGITQDVRPDHAQYLAHWLQLLKNDAKAIFTAAARASEAATYLRGLQSAGLRATTTCVQAAAPIDPSASLAAEALP
ncbi:MAG: zincin-like metallopeptidase domain-containing protein [Hyphomicrobiaceae bacterium]